MCCPVFCPTLSRKHPRSRTDYPPYTYSGAEFAPLFLCVCFMLLFMIKYSAYDENPVIIGMLRSVASRLQPDS